MGDLRLLEDGSERGGAFDADVVAADTAGEGRSEDGERAAVSRGADTKANTRGAAAHLRWEIIVSLRTAASAEAPSLPMRLLSILRGMGVGAQ